jgi:hypothetical protein
MPDECTAGRTDERRADAAFREAREPWLAAAILISGWGGEAAREALSRALAGERAGDLSAADFWVEVHGCIRRLW